MSKPTDSILEILITDPNIILENYENGDLIEPTQAIEAIESLIQAARIAEALDIRENIAELGTPVYFALQRIDGHISKLQKEKKNATQ